MRQNDNPDQQDQDDLSLAVKACDAGAKTAAGYFRKTQAKNKASGGDYDPVTEGDQAAERAIRQVVTQARPDDDVLGEEYGHDGRASDRCWIIDPIDGTRAFVSGAPTWGTLVGLRYGGDFRIGAACQPVVGDMFSGNGNAAWLNGQRIRTRQNTALQHLRIATTDDDLLDDAHRETFAQLKATAAITRYGLDWYAYGLLAAGHLDLVFECGLKIYDIAALVPIVRGAGGTITDFQGGNKVGPTVLAASCAQVHAAVLAMLQA